MFHTTKYLKTKFLSCFNSFSISCFLRNFTWYLNSVLYYITNIFLGSWSKPKVRQKLGEYYIIPQVKTFCGLQILTSWWKKLTHFFLLEICWRSSSFSKKLRGKYTFPKHKALWFFEWGLGGSSMHHLKRVMEGIELFHCLAFWWNLLQFLDVHLLKGLIPTFLII